MNLRPTALAGVMVAESRTVTDFRGAFSRLYCRHELADAIGDRDIVQINHSRTRRTGVVRGFHFQRAPAAEMKLIRCLAGHVYDVAVDLRADSSTYLQWHAEELTADNARMLVIPEGCAHGFQTLAADSELLYLHTHGYSPADEGGVRFDDPMLAIPWPLPVIDVSDRDRSFAKIAQNHAGIGS